MSKYRVKYQKGDEVKFISHLDFLRTVKRAFKRADIPFRYSQGFNPHTIMTVALPLSVGVTSSCECMDIELEEDIDLKALLPHINDKMPLGITILDAKKADGERAFKHITSALYIISYENTFDIDIDKFCAMREIIMDKRTKKGIKETDIRPDILSIENLGGEVLKMHLNAGSANNLKPELVLSAIEKYCNVSFDNIKIHREKIFFEDNTEVF